ncbi:MAG: hypothetical protein ACI8VZ_001380 [Candidatus Paceibacteria bacterium]|jgi:hypothetical protein
MDRSYTSISAAITALQQEGYTEGFNQSDVGIENKKKIYPA